MRIGALLILVHLLSSAGGDAGDKDPRAAHPLGPFRKPQVAVKRTAQFSSAVCRDDAAALLQVLILVDLEKARGCQVLGFLTLLSTELFVYGVNLRNPQQGHEVFDPDNDTRVDLRVLAQWDAIIGIGVSGDKVDRLLVAAISSGSVTSAGFVHLKHKMVRSGASPYVTENLCDASGCAGIVEASKIRSNKTAT
jgi:hypothetical protein